MFLLRAAKQVNCVVSNDFSLPSYQSEFSKSRFEEIIFPEGNRH